MPASFATFAHFNFAISDFSKVTRDTSHNDNGKDLRPESARALRNPAPKKRSESKSPKNRRRQRFGHAAGPDFGKRAGLVIKSLKYKAFLVESHGFQC
jgi:hypothetical protein